MGIIKTMYSNVENDVVDTVILGGFIKAIINFVINLFMELAFSFIRMVMGCLTVSSSMFDTKLHPEFGFVSEFHHVFKIMGLAMVVLIACWQIFKSFYAYMGFEAEESWRVVIRMFVLSFLIIHSKDIIIMSLKYVFDEMIKLVWNLSPSVGRNIGDYISVSFEAAWESIKTTHNMPGGFLVNAVLFVYLAFKLVMLCFKLAERYILVLFYAITFPLALSAEVSKATKPYFQGWVKGFVGNLIVQISQVTVFLALTKFWETGVVAYKDGQPVILVGVVIAVAMIKILDKVEEIVRDTGMGVGFVSGPAMGPMDMVQSYYYKVTSAESIAGRIVGSTISGSRNADPNVIQRR